jgi:hypothetical protein
MRTPAAGPPGTDDTGQAIAAARKARGLTQSELARQAVISLSLLRKGRAGQPSADPRRPCGARHCTRPGTSIRWQRSWSRTHCRSAPATTRSHGRLRHPARPAACHAAPRGTAPPDKLSDGLAAIFSVRKTRRPPPRVNHRPHSHGPEQCRHEQEQAFALLALAYRAADAIADKHGRHDMSGRATELIRWAAARSADPLLDMMSTYIRAELFFSGQHAPQRPAPARSQTVAVPPASDRLCPSPLRLPGTPPTSWPRLVSGLPSPLCASRRAQRHPAHDGA